MGNEDKNRKKKTDGKGERGGRGKGGRRGGRIWSERMIDSETMKKKW